MTNTTHTTPPQKRKRGRPPLDATMVALGCNSRRQELNRLYMSYGIAFLSVAAADVPNAEAISFMDEATKTARFKRGILEQIGRMWEQDHRDYADCVRIASLAAEAIKQGCHAKSAEKAIRSIRMAMKRAASHPDDPVAKHEADKAVWSLVLLEPDD